MARAQDGTRFHRTLPERGVTMRKGLLVLCAVSLLVAVVTLAVWPFTRFAPAEAGLDTGNPSIAPQAALPQADSGETLDELFESLAETVPGFGGMFYDKEGNLNVYLLDPTQWALTRATVSSVFGAERVPRTGIRVLAGQYGFSDLKIWHDRMAALFELPGVVFTDIDEMNNCLSVGVEDLGIVRTLEQELDRLGIPRAAVGIEEAEPIVFSQTLRDRTRPLQGGLQIAFSTFLCTLGFNAIHQGAAGFVVNAHCTVTPGGVEGTVYHQPTTAGGGDRIGVETADPLYFAGGVCPVGKVCRYSDSAFAQRDAGVAAGLGLLERTTGLGAIAVAGSYRIVGTVAFPLGGELLNKVGRTTGWTQGNVAATCVDAAVSNTNIVMLCQDVVGAGVGAGDSGSPVFRITDSPTPNDVELYGILWGGNVSGTEFVFSSIGQVQWADELGPLQVIGVGVGGTQALPDVVASPPETSSSSCPPYTATAGAAAAALFAITVGGWYARRRRRAG